MNEKVFNVKLC